LIERLRRLKIICIESENAAGNEYVHALPLDHVCVLLLTQTAVSLDLAAGPAMVGMQMVDDPGWTYPIAAFDLDNSGLDATSFAFAAFFSFLGIDALAGHLVRNGLTVPGILSD